MVAGSCDALRWDARRKKPFYSPSILCVLQAIALLPCPMRSQVTLDNGQGRVPSGEILFTWGRNDFAQLGAATCTKDQLLHVWNCQPDRIDRYTPSPVLFLKYELLRFIALGDSISMVQTLDETVYSWGRGKFLGRAEEVEFSGTPGVVDALHGAVKLFPGVKHSVSILPAQQGDAFEYDDFQNFRDDFSFVGDAAPSFSSPLACPRCIAWENAKPQPIGFTPVTGFGCHAPIWGPSKGAWCYVGAFEQPPCQQAIADDLVTPEGGGRLRWYRTLCVDNGRIMLTPYPPEPGKRGCAWRRARVDAFRAFSVTFQFAIVGAAFDSVHGGGDGLVLVLQNDSPDAIGGTGRDLGVSRGDRTTFTQGIKEAAGLELRTADEPGIVLRSCGRGAYQTRDPAINATCVVGMSGFNSEASVMVHQFEPLDVQDGRLHSVQMRYAPFLAEVMVDDMLNPRIRVPFSMADAVRSSDGKMWAGFCGATGDAISSIQVLSWRFLSLQQEGGVYAFGDNTLGQLGLDDRQDRGQPNLLTDLDGSTIIDAASGKEHSLALGNDGRVYAWGGNSLGQLGLGGTTERLTPTVVRRLWDTQRQMEREGQFFKPILVAAGHFHSLVVVDRSTHHEIYGFGDNSYSQLGCVEVCDDDQICRSLCPSVTQEALTILFPSKLSTLAPNSFPNYASTILSVASISAGAFHSVVLAGPCEACVRPSVCNSPPTCNCSLDLIGECAGREGDVLTWGSNVRGQLGDGRGATPWATSERPLNIRYAPESSLLGHAVTAVSAGSFHNLALTSNGSVFVWGGNYYGQLGLGDRRVRTVPVTIPFFGDHRRATRVAAGGDHSSVASECTGPGFKSASCDCLRGYKGYDCATPCNGGPSTPCSGQGTFDREYRVGFAEDASYDCEPDGSCTCRRGYQGDACEIACRPTETRKFRPPVGTRLICECIQGYTGTLCDIRMEGFDDGSASTGTAVPATPVAPLSLSRPPLWLAVPLVALARAASA